MAVAQNSKKRKRKEKRRVVIHICKQTRQYLRESRDPATVPKMLEIF